MEINDIDISVLQQSVEDQLAFVRSIDPREFQGNTSIIDRNREHLLSVRKKLRTTARCGSLDLNANEMLIVYNALTSTREETVDSLDEMAPSDPDRDTALTVQKTCNKWLRLLRKEFQQAGIEV